MRILDKNKDYYDYLCNTPDSEPDVFFDRRGSFILKQSDLIRSLYENKRGHFVYFSPSKNYSIYYFGLYCGYSLYIFKTIIQQSNVKSKNTFLLDIQYSYSPLELIMKIDKFDRDHNEVPLKFVYLQQNTYNSYWQKNNANYEPGKDNINNFIIVPMNLNSIIINGEDSGTNSPILRNLEIQHIIPPLEIYTDIEYYIASRKDEQDVESKGITDVEKAINHGFD